MKILKNSPTGKHIFDTENPGQVEQFPDDKNFRIICALHHYHHETDFEYLKKYFAPDHDIFRDFGRAFFSVI